MNDTIVILVLGFVVVFQGIERYLFAKDMTNKLNDAIKAVMSRNIGEYIAATTIKPTQTASTGEESAPIETLDDKAFEKVIKQM